MVQSSKVMFRRLCEEVFNTLCFMYLFILVGKKERGEKFYVDE